MRRLSEQTRELREALIEAIQAVPDRDDGLEIIICLLEYEAALATPSEPSDLLAAEEAIYDIMGDHNQHPTLVDGCLSCAVIRYLALSRSAPASREAGLDAERLAKVLNEWMRDEDSPVLGARWNLDEPWDREQVERLRDLLAAAAASPVPSKPE